MIHPLESDWDFISLRPVQASLFSRVQHPSQTAAKESSTATTAVIGGGGVRRLNMPDENARTRRGAAHLPGLARSLHIIFIHPASVHAKSLSEFKKPKQVKCHAFQRHPPAQASISCLPPPPKLRLLPAFCFLLHMANISINQKQNCEWHAAAACCFPPTI